MPEWMTTGWQGRTIAVVTLALMLSGCGGGLDPMGGTGPVAAILAFNGTAPPTVKAEPTAIQSVDCPRVEAFEGKSALRVGGEANTAVRHQYSLGDVARECTVVGNQISIKVGVQGRVLIGPAGSPGSFSVPVRVAVRSEKGQKIVAGKVYYTSAVIPAGGTQVDFTVVSEPMLVPLTRLEADEDYTVLVGFDSSGSGAASPRRRRR